MEEIKEVKQAFRNAVQERYSGEGVKKIEIKKMTKDGSYWKVEGIATLKNGDEKKISATVAYDDYSVREFSED